MDDEHGLVTITQSEYECLLDASEKLGYLEAGGVDNWEWYSESLAPYWKAKDEE